MGTAVWKGLVRFGLISIPVKLYRAAKAEGSVAKFSKGLKRIC